MKHFLYIFLLLTTSIYGQIIPYNYGSYNYGSYDFRDKTVNYLDKIAVPGGTKEACYSGFLISGTDTLWKDISGHSRHATLHYAKNFVGTSEWNYGILPYASEVLVAFPTGLSPYDHNNFMFAAGGSQNQIPAISLFQNIDYADWAFCKEITQRLNSDSTEVYGAGVRYFTVYSATQTGGNLTACNTWFGVPVKSGSAYYVAKTNLDGSPASDITGNGSEATPYLTIEKAYKTVAAGSLIYVKSGVYYEEYNSTTLRYLWLDKDGTILKSIGRAEIRALNTTQTVRVIAGNQSLTGFIINSENKTQYNVGFYAVNDAIALDKCYLMGATTQDLFMGIDATTQTASLTNSVVNKGISVNDGVTVNNCLLNNITLSKIRPGTKFYYNKSVNSLVYYSNSNLIKFNNFICNKNTLATGGATGSPIISNNKFTFTFSNTGSNINVIDFPLTASQSTPTISNNTFTSADTGTLAREITYIRLEYCKTPTVYNNIFISTAKSIFYHVFAEANDSVVGAGSISNNYSTSNSTSGISFALGGESTKTGVFNAFTFSNNYIRGHLYNYPSVTATTHGVLINSGINLIIKNNKIEYFQIGLVVKTGAGNTYTSGGVFGNLFVNNGRDIWGRKIKGLLIANNTLYGTSDYDKYSGGRIYLDSFDGYSSENDSLVNNIIYQTSSYYRIGMDAAAAANCKVVSTIISPTGGNMLYNGSAYRTFAQATSDGIFIDCTAENASITESQLWPTTPLTGTILSAPYNTILGTSTSWGSSTQTPSIVTFTNSSGQIGAFGQ